MSTKTPEYNAVIKCTLPLETALKNDNEIMALLRTKEIIDDGKYDELTDLDEQPKGQKLFRIIRDAVKEDKDFYHQTLMPHFEGKPIYNTLNKECQSPSAGSGSAEVKAVGAISSSPAGIRILETDIQFLAGLIGSKAFKWRDICGQCGLLPGEIDGIGRDPINMMGGQNQCLTAGLTKWCNISPTDGQHVSYPTLEVLVKALRSQVVGEGVLAETVWGKRHELPSLRLVKQ